MHAIKQATHEWATVLSEAIVYLNSASSFILQLLGAGAAINGEAGHAGILR